MPPRKKYPPGRDVFCGLLESLRALFYQLGISRGYIRRLPSGLACDAVQEVTHRLLGQLRHGIFGGYADYMVIAFIYR